MKPRANARRGVAGGGAQALFDTLTQTIGLLRWVMIGLTALYAASGVTRVAPHEDALIYRFGRLQRVVHPPGLLLALPAPIDRVVKVPSRTQHEIELAAWMTSAPGSEGNPASAAPAAAPAKTGGLPERLSPAMLAALADETKTVVSVRAAARGLHPFFDGYTLTGDVNIVRAIFGVRYRIVDPLAYASAAQPEARTALLSDIVYEAATVSLAAMRIDLALSGGLESFRSQVRERAQARVDALGLGVELTAFEVHGIMPPKPTNDAFAEVTSAQVEARTTVEQARTHRAQTLPKAMSEDYRIRQQATAEAGELVARAQGQAASFERLLAEYRAAPALVRDRLRAETLEEYLPKVKTQTVLPAGSGANVWVRDSK